MFITVFSDDPKHSLFPLNGDNSYNNDFLTEYDKKREVLDRFLYLVDTYIIIEDCTRDLLANMPQSSDTFWKSNKCLLNYVNAVFCYREFVNSYNPSLTDITDKYYDEKDGHKWYRFICDYRNRIVHQSVIVKDYIRSAGELLVDLDDLIKCQDTAINDLQQDFNATPKNQHGKRNRIQGKLANAKRFKSRIEELAANPHYEKDGHRYYYLKTIARLGDTEISEMNDKVLDFAYEGAVLPVLCEILDMVQYEFDGQAQYTIIRRDVGKDEWASPNDTIEWYFRHLLLRLTPEHSICQKMKALLEERRYLYIYSQECDLNTFIERCSQHS